MHRNIVGLLEEVALTKLRPGWRQVVSTFTKLKTEIGRLKAEKLKADTQKVITLPQTDFQVQSSTYVLG